MANCRASCRQQTEVAARTTRRTREPSEGSADRYCGISATAARARRKRGTASILVLLPTYTTPLRRRSKHAPRRRRSRRLRLLDFQLLARVRRIRANRVGRRAGAGHEQLRDGVDARGRATWRRVDLNYTKERARSESPPRGLSRRGWPGGDGQPRRRPRPRLPGAGPFRPDERG